MPMLIMDIETTSESDIFISGLKSAVIILSHYSKEEGKDYYIVRRNVREFSDARGCYRFDWVHGGSNITKFRR